ncbi:hypothetical protein BX283_3537 [Streptomyces sp. TLI_146]|nr:hypothetical protein BX283_3537 [Streptomyces sp. TLI_146]
MARWSGLRGVPLVAVAALVLVACGGGADAEGDNRFVAAGQLCGGAFQGEAVSALETVTGAKLFFPHSEDEGVSSTASALADDFRKGAPSAPSPGERTMCSVYAKGGGDLTDARLRFALYDEKELLGGDLAPSLHPYAMGKRALAGVKRSYLYFECVSPALPGSKGRPALVGGELSDRYPPDVDSRPLREASLIVLHSASRALAVALGCERGGGLPEKPVLVPSRG